MKTEEFNKYLVKVFKAEETKYTLKGRELGLEEIFYNWFDAGYCEAC